MSPLRFIFLIWIFYGLLLISGCKKDRELLPYETITIDPAVDLIGLHDSGSDQLYVSGGTASKGIIYRSSDRGKTWHETFGYFDKWINDIWIDDSTGFCADQDVLIYNTTNAGFNWQQYEPDEWPLSVNRNLRDIFSTDDGTFFICGGKNFGNGLIYSTYDSGQNWDFSEYSHELRGLHFNSPNTGVSVGYGVILRTTDQGQTWVIKESVRDYYTSVTGDMQNTLWTCSFNGSIYKSTDNGQSFRRIREGNGAFSGQDRFTSIAYHSPLTLVACGHDGLISLSDDGGSTWKTFESFNGDLINDVILLSNERGIAAGESGNIYRFRF